MVQQYFNPYEKSSFEPLHATNVCQEKVAFNISHVQRFSF